MKNSTNQGISVLMPVKNAEKTIVLAVKSTLRAMNKRSEILILLDGCSDSTETKVRSIKDPRIRVISSTEPLGVARALNQLAAEAKFEILARMDGDDITLPWRFKTQLKAFSKLNPDILFPSHAVFGDPVSPRLRPSVWCKLNPAESRLALCVSNPFVHPGAMMKKSVYIDLGGYKECPAEDYDLWIRACLANYSIVRIATPGILIRLHGGSVTQNPVWQEKLKRDPQVLKSLAELRRLELGGEDDSNAKIAIDKESVVYRKLLSLARKQRTLVKFLLFRNLRKVTNE